MHGTTQTVDETVQRPESPTTPDVGSTRVVGSGAMPVDAEGSVAQSTDVLGAILALENVPKTRDDITLAIAGTLLALSGIVLIVVTAMCGRRNGASA